MLKRRKNEQILNFKKICIFIFCIFIFLLLIFVFDEGDKMKSIAKTDQVNNISKEDWDRLGKQKIYFGHQSVGFNIMEGIEHIVQTQGIRINLIELNDNEVPESDSFFAHGRIGENRAPIKKFKAFKSFIKEHHEQIKIAFMKCCYVDINQETDLDTVFSQYKETMAELRKNYPDVTVIHFTVPLETSRIPMKHWFKIFSSAGLSYKWHMIKNIGKIWRHESNIARNKYNDMIRQAFDSDLLFDLAKIESTHTNGSREGFEENSKFYNSLAPDYTYDGGHLNDLGKRVVASNLLSFIVEKTAIDE